MRWLIRRRSCRSSTNITRLSKDNNTSAKLKPSTDNFTTLKSNALNFCSNSKHFTTRILAN